MLYVWWFYLTYLLVRELLETDYPFPVDCDTEQVASLYAQPSEDIDRDNNPKRRTEALNLHNAYSFHVSTISILMSPPHSKESYAQAIHTDGACGKNSAV